MKIYRNLVLSIICFCTKIKMNFLRFIIIFVWWRIAPQQKLRTHRSLKAYCATLMMKMKRKMVSFCSIFPWNGAPVE
jgi:hypothetical protein